LLLYFINQPRFIQGASLNSRMICAKCSSKIASICPRLVGLMSSADAVGWGLLVSAGWLTGFLSGLLGIGGGLVIVPALILGLPLVGAGGDELAKVAIATSLVLIIPTSLASSQAHAARRNLDWELWAAMAPSIVAGGLVAAMLVQHISAALLTLLFAGFALISAWRLLRNSALSATANIAPTRLGLAGMAVKAFLGGALSTALGTGVAFFAVPILSRWIPLARAIGTASALALPMAIAGAAGYLLAPQPVGCAACTGYVHFPAVAAVGVGTVLAAPVGAQLTAVWPARRLRQLFALLLIAGTIALLPKTLPKLAGNARASLAVPPLAWSNQNAPAVAPSWLAARQQQSIGAHLATAEANFAYPPGSRSPAPPLIARLMARRAAARGAARAALLLPPSKQQDAEVRRPKRQSKRVCVSGGREVGCAARDVGGSQVTALPSAPLPTALQTLFGGR
jgi:uncharacterized protein